MLAALLTASACVAPAGHRDAATSLTVREIDATLERRAAAVLARDPAGYLDTLAPDAVKLRAAQRTEARQPRRRTPEVLGVRGQGHHRGGRRVGRHRGGAAYRIDGCAPRPRHPPPPGS
ncbi:hypothetical protein SMICM304S_00903 [Streptomyces microflavus]